MDFVRLKASGTERDKIRLLSAGGPNAGRSLVAAAGLKAAHFADEEFMEILKWRLGIPAIDRPMLCQNTAAATGSVCEEALTEQCDHALCCSYGPLRIRRHDDVAEALADVIDDTGAHVRREVFLKEFSTDEADAWLDIWAFGAMQIPELIIDVTIRHPTVERYRRGASQLAGAAAAAAEDDKQSRYPPTRGRQVHTFAMETWGRLGEEAEEMLTVLAAEATRHARRRGHSATANTFLRKWRATLDAQLQRGVASALLAARNGLPGKPHKRSSW